jgi:hypothetical protein
MVLINIDSIVIFDRFYENCVNFYLTFVDLQSIIFNNYLQVYKFGSMRIFHGESIWSRSINV